MESGMNVMSLEVMQISYFSNPSRPNISMVVMQTSEVGTIVASLNTGSWNCVWSYDSKNICYMP